MYAAVGKPKSSSILRENVHGFFCITLTNLISQFYSFSALCSPKRYLAQLKTDDASNIGTRISAFHRQMLIRLKINRSGEIQALFLFFVLLVQLFVAFFGGGLGWERINHSFGLGVNVVAD